MSERTDKELTDAPFGASRSARMKKALEMAFSPITLHIEDQSERHRGHAGAQEAGGETHYHITIVSSAFTGMSRIARQRAVMAALQAEFASGLHALAMRLNTPDEVT